MRKTFRGCGLLLGLFVLTGCDNSTEPETANITGAWAVEINAVCEGAIVVEQKGETFELTGWIGGDQCPYLATGEGSGTIEGNAITFGIGFGEVAGEGLGEVEFTGSVSSAGNSMSGTWSATGMSGQWTAVPTQLS